MSAMDEPCGQFDSLIARAGQLSAADAARLQAHLAGCEPCRELARLLEPVDSAVAFADTNASEPLADTHGDTAASRQDRDLPGATTDRYRITGEVGRGGIGRVLRAQDRVLDRSVALKELFAASDKTRERFIREALITARLQHPSIVPVYDAGHRDGRFALYAMKLVAGRPLDESIAETSTLAQRLALLPIVLAIADAMAYAHSQRIWKRAHPTRSGASSAPAIRGGCRGVEWCRLLPSPRAARGSTTRSTRHPTRDLLRRTR
jgi:hypothetical protein